MIDAGQIFSLSTPLVYLLTRYETHPEWEQGGIMTAEKDRRDQQAASLVRIELERTNLVRVRRNDWKVSTEQAGAHSPGIMTA